MFLIRLVRLIFWVLVALWVIRLARRLFPGGRLQVRPRQPTPAETSPEQLHRDPACGRFIPGNIALIEKTGGGTMHFCSRECRDRFLGAPTERTAG